LFLKDTVNNICEGHKALSYFGDIRPSDLPPAAREQQARALQTIGEVARSRGDPNGARRALLLAKTLLDTNLSQGHETANLLKDLGADAFWLGQISLDEGRLDQAESYFQQYQRYSERMLAREPENVDAWVEVSYASNSLGSVAQARSLVGLAEVRVALGERAAALEACREAITTLQPLIRLDAHNYETQDLWVRAHICVGEGDKVAATRQWLAQIGYRQAGYLRFLSQQQ